MHKGSKDPIEDTVPISANTNNNLKILEYFLTFTNFVPMQLYAECINEVEDTVEESSDDATKVMTIRGTLK